MGYQKLIDKYHSYSNISFIEEKNFKDQTTNLCFYKGIPYVMLLTDDSVFYSKVPFSVNEVSSIMSDDVFAISLRLGENTIIQNYLTMETQRPLRSMGGKNIGDLIKWKFRMYPLYSNYNYIGSLDGQIYRAEHLQQTLLDKDFCIPRGLEYQLVIDKNLYNSIPQSMICPKKSCVFVNTINAVQDDSTIPAGTKYNFSAKTLNDKWLCNEKISLNSFKDLELRSSHEEVPLLFERADSGL